MKRDLLLKMKAYSVAAGAVIAVGSNADAQVVYSGDISELVTTSYDIDLDGDAVNDFTIGLATSSSYKSVNLTPVASGNQWLSTALYNNYVKAIPASTEIGSVATPWGNDTFLWNMGWIKSGTSNYPGNFIGQGDQFIGVKFDISGAVHYGWIRVNVAADATQLTVIDWAYESTADGNINAGDIGGVSVNTLADGNINVFPNPSNGIFNLTPNVDNFSIEVSDITGRVILTDSSENHLIDLSSFGAGTYFIKIITDEGTAVKRVIVK